jgi:hypothetical protein
VSERLISSMRVRCHLSRNIERAVQNAMPAPPLAAAMSNQSIAGRPAFWPRARLRFWSGPREIHQQDVVLPDASPSDCKIAQLHVHRAARQLSADAALLAQTLAYGGAKKEQRNAMSRDKRRILAGRPWSARPQGSCVRLQEYGRSLPRAADAFFTGRR